MKAIEVKLTEAEAIKKKLIDANLLDTNYLPKKEGNKLYFPIIDSESEIFEFKEIKVVDTDMPLKVKKKGVEEEFSKFLSEEEMKIMPKSQEIVGDIMILEIPETLIKKEKEIAEIYLKFNKNIKTIVKKSAIHSGQFRTRKVEVLAGENKKDTVHLESGIRLYLHLERSYFSARLGNERLRIAKLVKKGEDILVMFSGSGPYPLVLAKHTKANKIIGVELNPEAHEFSVKNREKNKFDLERIELINGDVRVEVPKLESNFDRILMPLPKTSEEFLDVALPKIKSEGTIHLYAFLNEKEIEDEGKRIVALCEEMGFPVKLERAIKCGQHAPYTFRVCFDLIRD